MMQPTPLPASELQCRRSLEQH